MTGMVVMTGVSKATPAAAKVIADFVGRVLGPTGDALGTAVAQPILDWQRRREERARQLLERAAEMSLASGTQPGPVPGRLLFPILEMGSVEDDPELAGRWAALLANSAIDPDGVLPAFASILAELSPREARIISRLAEISSELSALDHKIKRGHRNSAVVRRMATLNKQRQVRAIQQHLGDKFDEEAILSNLARLSLVRRYESSVRVTAFGKAFVSACTRPMAPDAEERTDEE